MGEQVKDVRISTRLTESPSCLVADEHEMGGNLARILKAAGQKVPEAKPILEVNPGHPIVARLDSADPRLADWAHLLFDLAGLYEGVDCPRVDSFAGLVEWIDTSRENQTLNRVP